MLGSEIWSVLTFLSSVARAQCVLRVYVASPLSAQSLSSRLVDPRVKVIERISRSNNFFRNFSLYYIIT